MENLDKSKKFKKIELKVKPFSGGPGSENISTRIDEILVEEILSYQKEDGKE